MRLAVEQGDPDVHHRGAGRPAPRSICARTPFSTEGTNCRGTAPPTTLSTNSKPAPGRQRLDLDVADGVLAVPAGLLDVPAVPARRCRRRSPAAAPSAPPGRPRRRAGSRAGRGARRRAPRPSPRARSGGSRRRARRGAWGPRRRSRARPGPSLSSSVLARASTAIGSSGSGIVHGLSTSGVSGSDRVSPVSARVSRPTAQMSPATTRPTGPLRLAQGHRQRADPLVLVVVLVPAWRRRRTRTGGPRRARWRRAGGCRRRPGPG